MQRARTQEAKDDRRAALAGAALDEFYEKGFAAARMEDIARRAGLSKGALYLYFDSKEALFEAVVENFAMPNVARVETIAESVESAGALIDAIAAMAPLIIHEGRVPKIMKVLIGDAPSFPAIVTAYRERIVDRIIDLFTRVLTKAKVAGEIDIRDPALTARLVIAPMVFSAVWRVIFGRDHAAKFDVDALFSEHAKFLKRAMRMENAA